MSAAGGFRHARDGVEIVASLIPWDTEIFGTPVVGVDRIVVAPDADPGPAVTALVAWLTEAGIGLASARLDARELRATMLLEAAGFRYIETVYDPVLAPLATEPLPTTGIVIRRPLPTDVPRLDEIAATAFTTGRHALDHRLERGAAGRRYRRWLRTSLEDPGREVLAILERERIVGLFVVERLPGAAVRWQLTAVAPDAQGRGVGRRTWTAMIERHRAEGVERIETTVSGHNLPVLGLYPSLGFRLTDARVTLHWVQQ